MHGFRWQLLGAVAVLTMAGMGCAADSQEAASEPASADTSNEVITNNQEEGVDEGGIVKNIGDHLMVLRQGRLYAVDVRGGDKPVQTHSVRVSLDEELNQSVWYDEMLVRGRDIYVIGYRYVARIDGEDSLLSYGFGTGTTEIAHFSLEEDGKIARQETQFFESMDYYDFSNYSSRMIGDRLIFYLPLSGGRQPGMLRYLGEGEFERAEIILAQEDIVSAGDSGVTHVLVTCKVGGQSCAARGLEGATSSARYVTRDDVYLWMGEAVWALSLEDGGMTQHAVRGVPRDQLSFKMMGDELKVMVSSTSATAERSRWGSSPDQLELLTLSRADFGAQADQQVRGELLYKDEEGGYVYSSRSRFTQDALLYAYHRDGSERVGIYMLNGQEQRELDLGDESVTRIEPMRGVGALIVSSRYERRKRRLFRYDSFLTLRAIKITEQGATIAHRVVLEGAREGETRSHGFFYKPGKVGGVFGLPILGERGLLGWWGSGISNIAFFAVSGEGRMEGYGAVSSSEESEGACETSCIDWYGNTRPIFLGERIFALMGSELAEVALENRKVSVLSRLVLEF